MSGYATDKEKGPGFDKGLGGSSHAIAADNTNEDLSAFMKEPGEVEVFATGPGNVDFRTVGWMKAAVFFLKMTFAVGVLSIPSSLYTLGLGAGIVNIVGWGAINTYCALLMGQFKVAHPAVHSISDGPLFIARQLGFSARASTAVREIFEAFYIFTCILAAGVSMLGLGIAFNAVSRHSQCTVVFNVAAFLIITAVGSVRKISHLAWVTWVGFVCVVVAVMIVVIAVTQRDRPAAAPQTGDFDLGFSWLPATGTTFTAGFAAALAIFASSGNTCAYVPVISEMHNPRDYRKSVIACMYWINSSYLAFTIVVFYYCGKWVASPALGSAGDTIKIISYAIAIPGLIAGAMVWIHVAGKTLFVRFLRNSPHLTSNSPTHWIVWLSCTFGVGIMSWLFTEVIPFFNNLVSLIGCLCYGPLSIFVPVMMWFSLHPKSWKEGVTGKGLFVFHVLLGAFAVFVTVAGTYATIADIVTAYRSGLVGGVFSCADNSGTIAGST
ncbi:MAG: hypothetical protein CYPHOPRED_003541 [Cyphobasidiales sp. Tagirdzhanova-0007]|nr:MAG: hypothetical protein CYPHOPRED_003541 [Cyphobasidiales sp. Tagirdzhanova-0007]